jgi:hypothetical protein
LPTIAALACTLGLPEYDNDDGDADATAGGLILSPGLRGERVEGSDVRFINVPFGATTDFARMRIKH